jgi:hypothetical protein
MPRAVGLSALIAFFAGCSNTDPRAANPPTPSRDPPRETAPRASCTPKAVRIDPTLTRRLTAGSYTVAFMPDCAALDGGRIPPAFSAGLELVAIAKEFWGPSRQDPDRDLRMRELAPLVGWFDHDLAALEPSGFHPPPTSQDPLSPGALVWVAPGVSDIRGPVRETLLIGTNFNDKEHRGWTDGSGIGLVVQSWRAGCFLGTFEPWGLLREVSGHFALCSLPLGVRE